MIRGENARAVCRRAEVLDVTILLAGVLPLILAGRPIWAVTSDRLNTASTGHLVFLNVQGVTFEFVRIEPGKSRMGAEDGNSDERPAHDVQLNYGFCIGRTEVTVRQFRAFVEATGYTTDAERAGWARVCPLPGLHPHQRDLDWRRPGFTSTDEHPVVVISRSDAMAFCQWLSEQTGRTARLPTEAEWEYAAHAGHFEASNRVVGAAAWYEENAFDGPRPVGAKEANAWGLHDMQGNVWEWCLDVWRSDYRGVPADGSAWMHDPTVPALARRYVLRGGSWASPIRQLSLSYRWRGVQHFCRPDTGFRIVLSTGDPNGRMSHAAVPQGKGDPAACMRDGQKGPTVLTTHGKRFEFVRIPAGEFMMGGSGEIEKPAHKVRIDYEFEMGITEVTVGQFRAFVSATGYLTDGQKDGYGWLRCGVEEWQSEDGVDWSRVTFDQSDDHPAIFISWYDAMAFCHWLSVQSGQEIRLPSEAEWEYACRAGNSGLFAGDLNAMAWYQYNSCEHPHPVARKQPNAWGLYDMHGNVWEWCLDFFAMSYDGAPTDGRPRWDAGYLPDAISRGGSFINPPGWLASGCRMATPPFASHYNNGFRLVRVLRQGDTKDQAAGDPDSSPALVPVEVELPTPMFVGTPGDFRAPWTKPVQTEAGPPFLAPPGTRNVALGKPISASDEDPVTGELEMITDSDKEAADGSFVELGPMLQYVTIDLGAAHEIYGVRVWHYHLEPRVYFDVIVQIADNPDFIGNTQTIFNNDMDNSAGLGVGSDMHYVDTYFGEVFDARGLSGRYVRLYSNGNTANDLNHYIEIEVYGRPVLRQ